MMRYRRQLVWLAFTFNDVALTWLALWLAYQIRFFSPLVLAYFPVEKGIPPQTDFVNFGVMAVIAVLWMSVFRFSELAYPKRYRTSVSLIITILSSVTLATLLLVGVGFFYRGLSYSRVVVGVFWVLDTLLIISSRLTLRFLFEYFRSRGYNKRRILIVGAGELGLTFLRKLKMNPGTGYEVVGFLDDDPKKLSKRFEDVKVIACLDKITDVIHEKQVHEVYVALPLSSHRRQLQMLRAMRNECVDVKVIPDLLQYITLRAGIEDIDGIPIINLTKTPLQGWNALFKRVLDIALSIIGLVLTAPLTIPLAIVIKLTSSGPVLFRQERMSLDGSRFTMLKFRSMKNDAESESGPVFTTRDDPRRTRIGVMIRELGLDELPQLLNVLKGDMSLVGPRPERPPFVEEFKKEIPYYMMRHKVKSGITGWAQINGFRGDTSIKKRIEYDVYYVQNWSLVFDLKIMFLTLFRLRKNAM